MLVHQRCKVVSEWDIFRETVGLGDATENRSDARSTGSARVYDASIGDRCFEETRDATERTRATSRAIGEFVQGPTPVSLHPKDHFRDCAPCCHTRAHGSRDTSRSSLTH